MARKKGLTIKQWDELIAKWETNRFTQVSLAEEYGVSQALISRTLDKRGLSKKKRIGKLRGARVPKKSGKKQAPTNESRKREAVRSKANRLTEKFDQQFGAWNADGARQLIEEIQATRREARECGQMSSVSGLARVEMKLRTDIQAMIPPPPPDPEHNPMHIASREKLNNALERVLKAAPAKWGPLVKQILSLKPTDDAHAAGLALAQRLGISMDVLTT